MINVSEAEMETILEILRKHVPSREVWAFGSRVNGNNKRFSDLDIAIIGDAKIPLLEIMKLSEAFELSTLPFQVDVVDYMRTTANFRKIIDERRERLI